MKRTVEALVRLGYLSKAVVYLLVGALALKVAAGTGGGRITDPGGALYVVLGKPYGQAMLIAIAAGLLTYASWRIAGAFVGRHARHESMVSRALTTVKALVYGAMGVQAMKLGLGLRGRDSGPEPLVRAALSWPFGAWVILLAGVGVGWYGVIEIRDAIKGRLDAGLDAPTLRRSAGEWAVRVARGGIGARGVLLVMLGIGLVRAGLVRRASEAAGLDGALWVLNAMPQGAVLLGAAAAGVFAYGLYQFMHARYANITSN